MSRESRAHRVIVPALLVVSLSGMSAALAAGDPARGKSQFKATCEVCHLAVPNASRNDELTKIGPNLFGVVGRQAGTVKGFRYSGAMKASGITWTEEVLARYILAPQKMIPSVRMTFQGVSDQRNIDDIVAYLATLGYTARPGTPSAAPSR